MTINIIKSSDLVSDFNEGNIDLIFIFLSILMNRWIYLGNKSKSLQIDSVNHSLHNARLIGYGLVCKTCNLVYINKIMWWDNVPNFNLMINANIALYEKVAIYQVLYICIVVIVAYLKSKMYE